MVLAAVVAHLTFSLDRLQPGRGPVGSAAAAAPARLGIMPEAARRPLGALDGIPGPLGIRIAGRRFDDQRVLRTTSGLAERRPFPMAWPVIVQAEAAR